MIRDRDTHVGPPPEAPRSSRQKLTGQQLLAALIIGGGVYLRHRGMISEDGFLILEGIGAASGVTGASIVPAVIDVLKGRAP